MFHLAQLNVAQARTPLDAPEMAEFVAALDPINALADRSPGFVWRLQDETGDATSIRAYDDERVIVNMSVWESIEALWRFVYDSEHLAVMRRRREWFSRWDGLHMVLWWLPAGELPSVEEAIARLDALQANGPTPHAFTFKRHFPPPGDPSRAREIVDDRLGCPG